MPVRKIPPLLTMCFMLPRTNMCACAMGRQKALLHHGACFEPTWGYRGRQKSPTQMVTDPHHAARDPRAVTAPCFLKVVTLSICVHAQVGGGCRPGAHALRQSGDWRRCIPLPNYAQILLRAITCLKLTQTACDRVRCDRADAGYPAPCSDGAATKRREFYVGKRALKGGMCSG